MTVSGHAKVIFSLHPPSEAGRFILRDEGGVRYPKPPNSINSTILFTYFIVTHRNAR